MELYSPIMKNKVLPDNVAIVVDDHKMFATMFAMLLKDISFFSEVHIFSTEKEVMNCLVQASSHKVWVFLDYFIPEVNTHFLISDIRNTSPSAKIAIVSSFNNSILINKVLARKVDGVISKADGVDQILSFLQCGPKQLPYISPAIIAVINEGNDLQFTANFTPREITILSMIADGKRVNEISDQLSLSKHTIITFRRNLLAKTGFHSITELVAHSIKAGIISH